MFAASSRTPEGDEFAIRASRNEILERIGRDLLQLQDSCHLLRLACQIADYDATGADRVAAAPLTSEPADGPRAPQPSAAAAETLHA